VGTPHLHVQDEAVRFGALPLGQLRATLRGVPVALRAQQLRLQVGHALRGLSALRLSGSRQEIAGATICSAGAFAAWTAQGRVEQARPFAMCRAFAGRDARALRDAERVAVLSEGDNEL